MSKAELVDQLQPEKYPDLAKLYGFTVCRVRCFRSASVLKRRGRKPIYALDY